jgi:hypothetical protein
MVEIDRDERMRPGSSHSQRAAVKASSQRDYAEGGSEHGDREGIAVRPTAFLEKPRLIYR